MLKTVISLLLLSMLVPATPVALMAERRDMTVLYHGSNALSRSLTSNRWRLASKEEQDNVAGLPYVDFGARQYSTSIRRWMVQVPLSERYYDVSPYVYCTGDPVNYVDPKGMDGVKYIDENGTKTIETNVVVLLEKETPITNSMTDRQVRRTMHRNRSINQRNSIRISSITNALQTYFGTKENSNGEIVVFIMNVSAVAIDNPNINKLTQSRPIAVEYGIPANTPDRYKDSSGYGIARAVVFSTARPEGVSPYCRGKTSGKELIMLSDMEMETIAHEVGHSLGLTHRNGGETSGLMMYPPELLLPFEVDLIWNAAYDKK